MPELIENILTTDEAERAFQALKLDGNEIQYGQYYNLTHKQELFRLPRLMAFQASINDSGDSPWYRCKMSAIPQNQIYYAPWTPTMQMIKDAIEQKTNQSWNLAHIIYYKDGDDSMGMHSDTVLDLAPGSNIAIFSLGSTRQLDFLKKEQSSVEGPNQMKFEMLNNSLFLLDEYTNQHYVHGVRKVKKHQVEGRIAIVFRRVTMFKTEQGILYGNGSDFATREEIIQQAKQTNIVRYVLGLLLALLIAFSLPIFSSYTMKFLVSAALFYFTTQMIGQVQQMRTDYLRKTSNERLKKLCNMKNYQIWDQTDMQRFLNYS